MKNISRIDNDLLNYKSSTTLPSGVLKNKLGLTDEDELNKAERMITNYHLAKLYLNPGKQTFDVEHYLSLHKTIFGEIYDFAGLIRNEVISKRITFCPPLNIYSCLKSTLDNARLMMKNIKSRDELLDYLVILYSDLDVIHPFREGNGRVEREFIRQYIDKVCELNNLGSLYLDYNAIEDRNYYIDAVVKADALLDYGDLKALFDSILIAKEKEIGSIGKV